MTVQFIWYAWGLVSEIRRDDERRAPARRMRFTAGSIGLAEWPLSTPISPTNRARLCWNSTGATTPTSRTATPGGELVDQAFADEAVTRLASAGTMIWLVGDHLGTIKDLITYNSTTDDATVANHREWDSYGNLVSQSNSTYASTIGYTGRMWDITTDLQFNVNRWYDPAVGRWMNEDPIGFKGDSSNLSRYVNNSPTDLLDPYGLVDQTPPNASSGRPSNLTTSHTFGAGVTAQGSAFVAGSASAGVIASFPEWNPMSWELGLMISLSAGGDPTAPNGMIGGFVLESNATHADQLSGNSVSINGGASTVVGLGGNVAVGNLTDPIAGGNLAGQTPTTVTISGGVSAGADPVAGGVQYGPTYVGAISICEMKDLLVGTIKYFTHRKKK